MHLEVLVEEQSAEVALLNLLPRILGGAATFRILVHQGKRDLLDRLSDRLRGYRAWLPEDARVIVLIDEDRQDCRALKETLENSARDLGLRTRSSVGRGQTLQVLNRLAVEELEAWFFGDVEAIVRAYPRVPPTLGSREAYRDPDAIRGGTWEALERLLQKAGYFDGGLPKIEAARSISEFMDPNRNRSRSFRTFRDALQEIAQMR